MFLVNQRIFEPADSQIFLSGISLYRMKNDLSLSYSLVENELFITKHACLTKASLLKRQLTLKTVKKEIFSYEKKYSRMDRVKFVQCSL